MKPVILTRDQHSVSRKNIDKNALSILYRLHRNGFKAFLVGGCVRDSLLERTPKDFDVVTDARPNKIKKLFKRSVLIGKRFRLVHVIFGDRHIEVSTFRKTPLNGNHDGDLMLRRENTYGTPQQDALRRDFTVNALFYNISDFSVLDYVGGLNDLKVKLIRTIGDPAVRFQEDPARMIRAIRIAGRINFKIEEKTWQSIRDYREHILKCPAPRILEEIYHLIKYGSASSTMKLLFKSHLMEILIPRLHLFWENSYGGPDTPLKLLSQMDAFPLTNPFHTNPLMLSVLFYPLIVKNSDQLKSGQDLRTRVEEELRPFAIQYNLPRRHFDRLTQICIAQRWFLPEIKHRFKPMAFISRAFFGEALSLATLQMNAFPDRWKGQKRIWKDRIRKADIPESRRKAFLETLEFKSAKINGGKLKDF